MNPKIMIAIDDMSVDLGDSYTVNDDGSISIDLLTTRGVAMATPNYGCIPNANGTGSDRSSESV